MSAPLVTILTAVRNGARHLAATVESIRNQTFTDWEYLIVDDASTDETVLMVEDMARRDSRVRLLRRSTSAGPYVAANDGLREARGTYVVRTDADDLSTPNRIEAQLNFLAAHSEYRACVSYWQGFNDAGIIPHTVTPVARNSRVFRWALLLSSPPFTVPCVSNAKRWKRSAAIASFRFRRITACGVSSHDEVGWGRFRRCSVTYAITDGARRTPILTYSAGLPSMCSPITFSHSPESDGLTPIWLLFGWSVIASACLWNKEFSCWIAGIACGTPRQTSRLTIVENLRGYRLFAAGSICVPTAANSRLPWSRACCGW